MIAAKNHANGVHNPYAHVRKALDVEFCNTVSERNPLVAGPLRRTDCSMVSDGAAALVVADEETAATMARRASGSARAPTSTTSCRCRAATRLPSTARAGLGTKHRPKPACRSTI